MAQFNHAFLVTCEHASNHVPAEYASLFAGQRSTLHSHRAYDIGARELAATLAELLDAPIFLGETTRLLVDLNRSERNNTLFSRFTKSITIEKKVYVLNKYYFAYRNNVKRFVSACLKKNDSLVHISLHTFTPVLGGVERNADVGILYDPARIREKRFALAYREALRMALPGLRVRRNYPYRGVSDSLVTALRKEYPPTFYKGIEVEINQRMASQQAARQAMEVMSDVLKGPM